MSDIFISYASQDRARVRPLVEQLENAGWSVWWDPHLPVGQTFDDAIEKALIEARVVIVVWTRHSVDSRWVRSEAESAVQQGKAFPVRLDDVPLPLGASLVQTLDLTGWRAGRRHAGLSRLIGEIRQRMGGADIPEQPRHQPTTRRHLPAFLVLAVVLGALIVSLQRVSATAIRLTVTVTDAHFESATAQDFTSLINTSEVRIANVRQLTLPRTALSETRLLRAQEANGTSFVIRNADPGADTAAVTMEPLPLAAGHRVRIAAVPGGSDISIALDGAPVDFSLSVYGRITVAPADAASSELVFPSPRPIRISSVADSLSLNLAPKRLDQPFNPGPVSISSLGLFRYDTRQVGSTIQRFRVPTVVRGQLAIPAAFDPDRNLDTGSELRLSLQKGTITDIRQTEEGIHLMVNGIATALDLCGPDCVSMMPRLLERWITRLR